MLLISGAVGVHEHYGQGECEDGGCGDAGIVTSALAGLLGQARLYVVLGRERLLPPALPRFTPAGPHPSMPQCSLPALQVQPLPYPAGIPGLCSIHCVLGLFGVASLAMRGTFAVGVRLERLLTEQSTR